MYSTAGESQIRTSTSTCRTIKNLKLPEFGCWAQNFELQIWYGLGWGWGPSCGLHFQAEFCWWAQNFEDIWRNLQIYSYLTAHLYSTAGKSQIRTSTCTCRTMKNLKLPEFCWWSQNFEPRIWYGLGRGPCFGLNFQATFCWWAQIFEEIWCNFQNYSYLTAHLYSMQMRAKIELQLLPV